MKHKTPSLDLVEIPEMTRTVTIDDSFMIADNLDNSDPLLIFNHDNTLKLKFQTPFKINYNMILLCVSGMMKHNINLRHYTIGPKSMLLIPEGTIGEYIDVEPDTRFIMIAFSNSSHIISDKNIFQNDVITKLIANPLHQLSTDECDDIITIYNITRSRISIGDMPSKHEIVINAIRFILSYVSPALLEPKIQNNDSILLENFLTLVGRHATSTRELSFYANSLAITPRHLCRVIMRTTGKTVKQWICERIIMEAKVLLNEPGLTIQQISDALGFPNQSAFGTYFKKATSNSPLAYRNRS